ncbi:MAG: hypothetical protein HPY52_15535 [Firmicutes bacterium]|nr:hypothetical protein [Bacillota bacterium]
MLRKPLLIGLMVIVISISMLGAGRLLPQVSHQDHIGGIGLSRASAWVETAEASSNISLQISITAPLKGYSLEDALFLSAMAAYFGMDVHILAQYYYPGPSGIIVRPSQDVVVMSPVSLLSVVYVSNYYDMQPSSVIVMRRKGHGWGAIAHSKGIKVNGKGKAKGLYIPPNDADFERTTYVSFVSSYYGVPEKQVTIWLSSGIPAPELTFCLNLAARARVSPSTIIKQRRAGASWETIANRYRISKHDLSKPVPPKKRFRG